MMNPRLKNQIWREYLPVLVLYVLASLAVTFPLGFQIQSELPVGGDSWQNTWNLWWTQTALSEDELSLLYCPLIFHPQGLSLALHSNSYFHTFLGVLLQGFFSIETLHHFFIWIYFPACAFSAYILARRYLHSPLAALMAGWIYAFSPYRIGRYLIEQVDVLATAFLPLFILFLLSHLTNPRLRSAALASLFLLLQTLSSWYNGAFCALFALVALLYSWLTYRLPVESKQLWLGLVFIFVLPVIILSPLILPMVQDLKSPLFSYQAEQVEVSRETSSDLVAFFLPGVQYPTFMEKSIGWHGIFPRRLIQSASSRILEGRGSNVLEATSYLGWINLLLLLYCICDLLRNQWDKKRVESIRFWLFCSGVFALLCLGPSLQILGWDTRIPLPYFIINALPGFSVLRAPNRLIILVTLALGILIAFVLERWIHQGRRNLALLFAVLIALDFAMFPLERLWEQRPIPPVYEQIAADPIPGALVEIPSGYHFASAWYNVRGMYYQTRHRRPLLVGYISRTPEDPYGMLESHPFLRALSHEALSGQISAPEINPSQALSSLQALGVRYVVFHRRDTLEVAKGNQREFERVQRLLLEVFDAPWLEDEDTQVFRVESKRD